MKSTNLLYLERMHDLECDAYVEQVTQIDGHSVVILDQTVLYAQGGGQPYDTGVIESEDTKFIVEEVRFVDGYVHHIGHFEGRAFIQGEDVHCTVDKERRTLNSRLHSGGHLVDMAVSQLGIEWTPGKGYHFPDNPYVEYGGELELSEVDSLIRKLQQLCDQLIADDLAVSCKFVEPDKLQKLCRFVPDNLPKNKPTRVVQFGDFAVPCGGTHVHSLKALKQETITKLKLKNKQIRVGYDVSR